MSQVKSPPETIATLKTALDQATESLKNTRSKKMFGCHALWSNDQVFALVWKYGRIGFKLPNEESYSELMSVEGAEPWKAGPMKMAHWVLVPESFHAKPKILKKWAAVAQELCSGLEPRKNK